MKKYRHKNMLASFRSAFRGIMLGAKSQKNFRVGLIIGIAVLIAGAMLGFSPVEIAVVTLVTGFVLFAELSNTAIEFVVDTYFKTKYSEIAKMSKDVAAGAVLLSIFIAAIIGLTLFLPKIIVLVLTH